MQLKLLCWNIWIDGFFDHVADFLKASNADIIGLQEVQNNDPKRDIIGFLEKLGYQHVFAPVEKRSENDGPAIFSRYNIRTTKIFMLSQTNSRAAVGADIQVGNEILHVFSTHLLHTHQQRSEEQDEQAANLIKIVPREHTIVLGDFNATPQSEVIKKMSEVLVDADPTSTPTWSVYPKGCLTCNPQAIDTRLDYIFTTKDIAVHSFKVEISKGSDHLPISATIEI